MFTACCAMIPSNPEQNPVKSIWLQLWVTLFGVDPGGPLVYVETRSGSNVMYNGINFNRVGTATFGLSASNGSSTANCDGVETELPLTSPIHLALAVDTATGMRTLYRNGDVICAVQLPGSQPSSVSPPLVRAFCGQFSVVSCPLEPATALRNRCC
jgi:small ligand-binding sensory domain FIST